VLVTSIVFTALDVSTFTTPCVDPKYTVYEIVTRYADATRFKGN